jgi:alkaline phosphatase D
MMKSIYSSLVMTGFAILIGTGCAEKIKAPEPLLFKMMRIEREKEYQSAFPKNDLRNIKSVNRVAFVCCALQDQAQTLWSEVAKSDPDLIVFAGNAIDSTGYSKQELAAQYEKLDKIIDYRILREKTPFMSIWGELDFGKQYGDSSFVGKKDHRNAFLNYWKYIPKIQAPSAEGLDHSVIVGERGRRVQIIMLDTRYYLTPLSNSTVPGEFNKNWRTKASFLGPKQWKWLRAQLKKPANYRVIVSPVQLAANSWPGVRWGLFPVDRQRIFDSLRNAKANKVLFVSGGRGFGSFGKVDLFNNYGSLFDMTVGPVNGQISKREEDFHYVGNSVEAINYGLIELDWESKTLMVKLMNSMNIPVQSLKLDL